MSADDQYEQVNDQLSGDVPSGEVADSGYVSRTGQKTGPVPVASDNDRVEDPIDPAKADTDEALAQDDKDAIDQSNIIGSRTRGAAKGSGTYTEPGDEEGLPGPGDTGASAVAGGRGS